MAAADRAAATVDRAGAAEDAAFDALTASEAVAQDWLPTMVAAVWPSSPDDRARVSGFCPDP